MSPWIPSQPAPEPTVAERLAKLARIEAAMANYPEPSACDLHVAEGLITCGWKAAYMDVVRAAKEEK